jgi:chitinase
LHAALDQVFSYIRFQNTPENRNVMSLSFMFNHGEKYALHSTKDCGRSWKCKIEVYQTHSGLFLQNL